MPEDSQDMKYLNLCYKCSIGKHTQHSEHTGKGLPTGHLLCECPICANNCWCYRCEEFRKERSKSN